MSFADAPEADQWLTRSFAALERMLWCVVLASGFLARLQCRERRMSRPLKTKVRTQAFTDPA